MGTAAWLRNQPGITSALIESLFEVANTSPSPVPFSDLHMTVVDTSRMASRQSPSRTVNSAC